MGEFIRDIPLLPQSQLLTLCEDGTGSYAHTNDNRYFAFVERAKDGLDIRVVDTLTMTPHLVILPQKTEKWINEVIFTGLILGSRVYNECIAIGIRLEPIDHIEFFPYNCRTHSFIPMAIERIDEWTTMSHKDMPKLMAPVFSREQIGAIELRDRMTSHTLFQLQSDKEVSELLLESTWRNENGIGFFWGHIFAWESIWGEYKPLLRVVPQNVLPLLRMMGKSY
jgi:hypothetical protein